MKQAMKDRTGTETRVRDQRILSEVEQALLISGYAVTLQSVHVEAHAGCVLLSGRLPSFYLKQIVQTAAMKVFGVVEVRNEVRVD